MALTRHEQQLAMSTGKHNSGEFYPAEFVSPIKAAGAQYKSAPYLSSRPTCADSRLQYVKDVAKSGAYAGCQNWHFIKVSGKKSEYHISNECQEVQEKCYNNGGHFKGFDRLSAKAGA